MNASPFKTLHLTLWQTFTNKLFIIQFIVVIYLVNLCSDLITIPPLLFLKRLVAIIGISFLLFRPTYGLFVIIFFTAGFVSSTALPYIPFFGIGSIHVIDAILGGLLFFIVVRKLYYRFFYRHDYPIIRTPIDIPLLLFFITCVIALINGITQKAGFNVAFRSFRFVAYYLFFFLITNLIKNRRDLTLFITVVFFIALITSTVTILQTVLGFSTPILTGRIETLTTAQTSYAGVMRIVTEGLFLIYLSFISLGCIVATRRLDGKTILLGISVAILGLAILISFNRVMYITLLITTLLLIFLAPIQHKARFTSYVLATICATIVIGFFSSFLSAKLNKTINAAQERITSVSKVKSIQGQKADTLKPRMKEIEYALEKIKDHPILGIGLGTWFSPFREQKFSLEKIKSNKENRESSDETPLSDELLARSRGAGRDSNFFATAMKLQDEEKKEMPATRKIIRMRGFSSRKTKTNIPIFHNSCLDVVLRLGLVGTVPFIWLTALCLIRGFRNWKNVQDPFLRTLSLSLTVGYVGVLINALTSPILLSTLGAIPIPIIWGVNEVIYRIEGIEGKNI